MAVAHLLTFQTSSPDQILTQLKAYKERELDRSPPGGFRVARLMTSAAGDAVVLFTEWEDADALEDTLDSAPFEACVDLCEVHADAKSETRFAIAD